MRIHRLRLSNVKGVTDREVAFPDHGVIVLEGPNEIGKTTMIEALDVLLEEKDSSRKRHVLALRPVGRDVPTTIEAELSFGPYRFRYRKQWFRQPATELHVTAPRIEQLTGVAAHERVGEIIAQTTDVPLWRALRLMQAAPLAQVELGGSAALAAALDAAAQAALADGSILDLDHDTGLDQDQGAADASERAERRVADRTRPPRDLSGDGDPGAPAVGPESLIAAVEAEVARYLTAARGQPTGEYRAALDAVTAATTAAAAAEAAVAEVDADVRAHEQVAERARDSARVLAVAQDELTDLEARWVDVAALETERAEAAGAAEAADRDAARARERCEERAELIADIDTRTATVQAHAEAVAELAGELRLDELRLADLAAQRQVAATRVELLTAAVRQADLVDRADRTAAQVTAMTERLERAARADIDRREAAAELARYSLDEAAVRRVERAVTGLDLARSQCDADSARLTLRALEGAQRVTIDGAELTLDAGADYERSLTETVQLVLPGQLTLTVHPEAGAAVRGEAVAQAQRELDDALAAAGAADAVEARALLDQRTAAQHRAYRAADRLDDLLAGTTLNRLRDDLAAAEARLAADREALAALPRADRATPPGRADIGPGVEGSEPGVEGSEPGAEPGIEGAEPGDPAAAREALAAATDDLAGSTARHEALRAAVEQARTAHARADSLLVATRRELHAARDRLERLRGTDPDESLTAAVEAVDATRTAARARLAAAMAALGHVEVTELQLRLDAARSAVATAGDRVADLRDQRLAIEARLEQSGRQGRYEAFEATRTDLDHAQRRLASVERRAEAARLLHETLQSHRAAAQRRYVAPFADAVRRLGRVVYGPDLDIEVDDALAIEARILGGERITYDALSTGAKEQLAILTRLAVATLVDPDQGVPVVIDDALGYTDPRRLRRMAAAFSLVGADAQVLLLTCTPGRYDGIVGAHARRLGDEPGGPTRVAG